jgi:predicted RNase H-like HicB family nuclease
MGDIISNRWELSLGSYDEVVHLTIDLDREEDGRWIAEALELPGVMCYGQTRDEAISNAERLAIEVIADWIAHG